MLVSYDLIVYYLHTGVESILGASMDYSVPPSVHVEENPSLLLASDGVYDGVVLLLESTEALSAFSEVGKVKTLLDDLTKVII